MICLSTVSPSHFGALAHKQFLNNFNLLCQLYSFPSLFWFELPTSSSTVQRHYHVNEAFFNVSLLVKYDHMVSIYQLRSIVTFIFYALYIIKELVGGLVAQAVRRSPPTAGVPSSRLGPSMWVCVGFSRGFSRFPLPQISFHHFSTLISSISFHIIRPCDGASGVVGRHPCYSQTYNIGASSHLIPRPDLVLDTS